MEKKTKMWVAVGVVVIVVVGFLIASLYLFRFVDNPAYNAYITMDVSENETAYIINITNVDVYHDRSGELYGHSVYFGETDIRISREIGKYNYTRWGLALNRNEYNMVEYGIYFIDSDGSSSLTVGDKIIMHKSGGISYVPQTGDRVSLSGTPHAVSVSATNIYLP